MNIRSYGRNWRGARLALIFLFIAFLLFTPDALADPDVPEKLIYAIYWAGLRVGEASLSTSSTTDGMIIRSRAISAPFISIFYKVEDTAETSLYQDGYPRQYVLKVREGRHRRHKEVNFNPEQPQKVVFHNWLEEKTTHYLLEKRAYDPLSGFHALRKRPLHVGRSEHLAVFDSKKLWNVEVKVIRKERLKLPTGEFDTVVIKPVMESEGLFYQKGEFYIWLSDDEKKIPVMIKSRVKIGSFTAKLMKIV